MTPLEEKVARALAEARHYDWDMMADSNIVGPDRSEFVLSARAAIAVVVGEMREPTRKMLEALCSRRGIDGSQKPSDVLDHLTLNMLGGSVADYRAMLAEFERSALSPTTPEGRG